MVTANSVTDARSFCGFSHPPCRCILRQWRRCADVSHSFYKGINPPWSLYPHDGGGLVAKSCPTLETPWTVALQAPLSMGSPRQEYWRELPFLSPGDLPRTGADILKKGLSIFLGKPSQFCSVLT